MDIALIEDIFRTSFSIPCMYDVCENIITLFKFFVVERLKHEKKVFYKFQTVFLVHIKQVGQMASMVPLPGSHRAHTAYRKENKYSEAGVAALAATE